MTQKEIKNILESYEQLLDLANEKLAIIAKLDDKYETIRGIEETNFNNNYVNFKCDDSCRGSYDYFWLYFPITWLSKGTIELETIVLKEKEEKKKLDYIRYEALAAKQTEETKQKELEQLAQLKAKYE